MIVLDRVRKAFGPIVAVDDISFSVKKGEVLGFIGPNGAGKTTTMRILASLIRPDSGKASINGHDVTTASLDARRFLGYMPENTPLYGEMTVMSFLFFLCEVRGVQGEERQKEIDRVVQICSLQDVYYQTIETLSKGFRKRVGLAQTLVGDPPVLILDEPTDGLDPNQKQDVRTAIRVMAPDKAIIVSTHILEELESLCTRSIVINRGKIVFDASPLELKEQGEGRIEDSFANLTRGDR